MAVTDIIESSQVKEVWQFVDFDLTAQEVCEKLEETLIIQLGEAVYHMATNLSGRIRRSGLRSLPLTIDIQLKATERR